MRPPVIIRFILAITLVTLSAEASLALPPEGSITIGVVRDGASYQDGLTERIEEQVKLLLPGGATVRFKTAPEFNADWDLDRVDDALRAALADPEVDYVLATGLLASLTVAAGNIDLTKPVLSSYPQPEQIIDLPVSDDGTSLIDNYTFIIVPFRLMADVETFKTLVSIDTLYVAIDNAVADEISSQTDRIEAFEREHDLQVVTLPVHRDAARNAAVIDSTIQAVMLAYTPRLTTAQRRDFIAQLNAHGIPTFSHLGHWDVESGALAALTPDYSRQLVRRAAMNIAELYRGADVNDLPVALSVDSKLMINAKTAVEIGYLPSLAVRGSAVILNPEYLDAGYRPLTFDEVLNMAETQSWTVQIKDTDVEQSRREAQTIRGPMLPQIRGQAEATRLQNDFLKDQTFIPTEQGAVGLSVSQMIYNDRFISDYRSSKRLYEGNKQDREAVVLDVMTDAGSAFLNYVLARALNQVIRDNYQLTADNLDLAKRRLEVGYSGRDEVFRWEAQLATRRVEVFNSDANIERQRIALNQVLALDQSVRWVPQEIEVDEEEFFFLEGRITDVFANALTFEEFRAFMVMFGEENSPELLALTSVIEAQDIQLGQRQRQFILPEFGLSFDYNYLFHREPEVPGFDKSIYTFRLFASLPLFTGASRYYDMERIKTGMAGLQYQQDLTRDRVERRVRTAIRLIEASYPSLTFTRVAAENAKKNLDVVQEKYSQGIVNVTDLLSAQNESFVAGQSAVVTTYQFLLDLLEFQRALAWFEVLKTEEEKNELVRRIQTATGIGR
jgi:outer membrane protein TolC